MKINGNNHNCSYLNSLAVHSKYLSKQEIFRINFELYYLRCIIAKEIYDKGLPLKGRS